MGQQGQWDSRFENATEPGTPCTVLADNLHLLTKPAVALDLACGLGANALLLAEQGLDTHARDISTVALGKLQQFCSSRDLTITTQQQDIEQSSLEENRFDVIVISHFLYRPLCEKLIAALKPGGLIFYQTFTTQKPADRGPSSEKFLLAPNELLSLFSPLRVVFYRENGKIGDNAAGDRYCAQFIGQKN
ncbi:MAG: class I SAM-dependent methyltransferase [Pseudomonadales bacterium]